MIKKTTNNNVPTSEVSVTSFIMSAAKKKKPILANSISVAAKASALHMKLTRSMKVQFHTMPHVLHVCVRCVCFRGFGSGGRAVC